MNRLTSILSEQRYFYYAFVLILLDQATKLLVKGYAIFGVEHTGMSLYESIPLLGDTIKLTFIENPGMAFGIEFGWGKIFLSLFSIVAAVALAIFLYKFRHAPMWVQLGIMLLLAGATGNLIDRVFYGVFYDYAPLFYGKVVDFIDVEFPDFTIFGRTYDRWWVFNIADSCVSCGIVIMLLVSNKIPPLTNPEIEQSHSGTSIKE